MERALVIGDSGAIGGALAHSLRARGVAVTGLSRARDGLDLTDEASIIRAMAPLSAPFDRVIVATGVLTLPDSTGPERTFKRIDPASMAEVFALNTIGPAVIAKHMLALMPRGAPFTFAALGCMPYARHPDSGPSFARVIAEINRQQPAFTVHLGDTLASDERATDAVLLRRRQMRTQP